MTILKRKINTYLLDWKKNPDRLPLVVKGGRQIGKTTSVLHFANSAYQNIININFALEPKYKTIFADGYDVESITRNISLINPSLVFTSGQTLIFFDEIQACPQCATSLKSFKIDGRYDVICSGSMMGINYHEIESNSVGYKTDYEMHSMDFEEYLWAEGYTDRVIGGLIDKMLTLQPLSVIEMDVLTQLFRNHIVLGGMPKVVATFVRQKNFSGTLQLQRQLLLDYQEDITKCAIGLDKGRIQSVFNHLAVFLSQENKKFQITKVAHGARTRDYVGVTDWLDAAGIVNICYCLDQVSLPLKGNYNPKSFKLYFKDTGMLIASLDEEAQTDLRANRNFNQYKGAVYENIVADMLVKQGYNLYYYKNEKSTLEMDFFIRDSRHLIPVEVKATDHSTRSLNRLIDDNDKYPDIRYGIKLCRNNIGFNGKIYTFPYFLAFLLKRYCHEK